MFSSASKVTAPPVRRRRSDEAPLNCYRCGSTDHMAAKCTHIDEPCHKFGCLAWIAKVTSQGLRPGQGKPTCWNLTEKDENDKLGAILAGIHKIAQSGSKYRKLILTLKIKGRTLPLKWTLELHCQTSQLHSIKQCWNKSGWSLHLSSWWHHTANHCNREDKKQTQENLHQVFWYLQQYGLWVKLSKCQFFQDELEFWGTQSHKESGQQRKGWTIYCLQSFQGTRWNWSHS